MKTVYIGLGSNLNDPEAQLKQALKSLELLKQSKLIKVSSFYKSKAWGPIQDQPDFINAVAELHSSLSPLDLLAELKNIEREQGRNFDEQRYGPRCIDLDILLYGTEPFVSDELIIPHPRMAEREFVRQPLLEIAGYLEGEI